VSDDHDFLRAVLRGDAAEWSGSDAGHFIGLCAEYGVGPLAQKRLRDAGTLDRWPAEVQTALHRSMLESAAVVQLRERELPIVLEALAAAGVAALVIKGAAVARTHYPDPRLRPAGDVDLLVRQPDVDRCRNALTTIGYSAANETAGRFVTYQHHFVGPVSRGALVLDVHWRINNPQVFAEVLTFDEIDAAEAVSIPALGPHARCPSPVHALLHAAVHRVAHGTSTIDVLTLSDVHYIFSGLAPGEMRRFASLAGDRKMAAVALSSLMLAQEWFATRVPAEIVGELARCSAAQDEPSAVYLQPMRPVDVLASDLAALDGWRERSQLICEHVLPPASYMLRAYGVSSRALLPVLYAHRVVIGARRWLRPPRNR
jgi:putative nucleotidyltransferase-like protein